MNLPPRAQEIIDEMYRNYKSLAFTEENQRKLTFMIAEQICYELGPEWGCKSADSTRPQSPSNIAYQSADGLVCWRWLDGDGSISGTPFGVAHPPVFANIPTQNFIPVKPVNHLEITSPKSDEVPKESIKNLLDDIGHLSLDLAEVRRELDELKDELVMIKVKLDRRYVSKIFGVTVVTKPE